MLHPLSSIKSTHAAAEADLDHSAVREGVRCLERECSSVRGASASRSRSRAATARVAVLDELGAERLGEPAFVSLGAPASLADEELVEVGVRQRPADVGCCREVGGEDAVALERLRDSAHAELVELALEALPERCDLLVGGRGLADDLGHVRGPLAHDAGVVRDERESTPRVGLVDDLAIPGAFGHRHRLLVAAHAQVPEPAQHLRLGAEDGVDGLQGHPRLLGDLRDRGPDVAALGEEALGRLEDRLPGGGCLLAPARRLVAAPGLDIPGHIVILATPSLSIKPNEYPKEELIWQSSLPASTSATTRRGSRCSTRIPPAPAARPLATGSSATPRTQTRSSSRSSLTRPRKRSPPASDCSPRAFSTASRTERARRWSRRPRRCVVPADHNQSLSVPRAATLNRQP